MRAVVLRGGRLEVRETSDPEPGPGELLLRTLSTAICASDVHFMDHHDLVPGGSLPGMVYDEGRDIVLGHEFVGEVVAHGPDCTDQFPVGTRVTAMPILLVDGGLGGTKVIGQHPEAQGSFGELLVVNELMARAVVGDVSDDAVALVDAFAVGEFYVRSSAIGAGEVAIVIGAGAIGLSAVAALASRGIDPIVVSDFNPERRELAKQFGAHVLIDPADQSPFDAFRDLAEGAVDHQASSGLRMRRRPRPPRADHRRLRDVDPDLRRRRLVHRRHRRLHRRHPQGRDHPVRRRTSPRGLVRHSRRHLRRTARPAPEHRPIIGLDDVPEALELTRRSEGPPRIVVHPNQRSGAD